MRIDRLLCNLRFLRSRSLASKLVGEGHLRRNGARITHCSQPIMVGDVLTIPSDAGVRLVEVLALPERRGPPREARACYRVLDRDGETDIGAAFETTARGDPRP